MKSETRRFKLFKLLLHLSTVWTTLIIGIIYLPFMLFGGFTVALIGFMLALAAIFWLASIPTINRTEDGLVYEMDAQERAEKYFIDRGWWRYEGLSRSRD